MTQKFHDLVAGARSYRRFDQSKKMTMQELEELAELGRITPCGGNRQYIRFALCADEEKNEEIYNVFDTGKFLNRPPLVAISNTSGLAGIAHWINTYFKLPDNKKVDKNSELVNAVKDWVDEQYEEGRVTVLTDDELIVVIDQNCKRLGIDLI